MEKLIFPEGCQIEGHIEGITHEGDIVIEGDLQPSRVVSKSGGIRLRGLKPLECSKLAAPNGFLDLHCQTLTADQIQGQASHIKSGPLDVRESLTSDKDTLIEATEVNITQLSMGKGEIQAETLRCQNLQSPGEVNIASGKIRIDEMKVDRLVINGHFECDRLVAEHSVRIESGFVYIKYLECPIFEAEPEVTGIVVVATSEEVKATSVRGFLRPSELNMVSQTTSSIDLTQPAITPKPQPTPTPPTPSTLVPPTSPEPMEDFSTQAVQTFSPPTESAPVVTQEPDVKEDIEPLPEPISLEDVSTLDDSADLEEVSDLDEATNLEVGTDLDEVTNLEVVTDLEEVTNLDGVNDLDDVAELEEVDLLDTADEEEILTAVEGESWADDGLSTEVEPDDDDAFPLEDSLSDEHDLPPVELEITDKGYDDPLTPAFNLDSSDSNWSNPEPSPEVNPEPLDPAATEEEGYATVNFQALNPEQAQEVNSSAFFDDGNAAELPQIGNFDSSDPFGDLRPESSGSEQLDEMVEPAVDAFSFSELSDAQEVEELTEDDLFSVEDTGTVDTPPKSVVDEFIHQAKPTSETALNIRLDSILERIRSFFPDENYPKFINQIQNYVQEDRYHILIKERNKLAVLNSFDKLEHEDISQLARVFYQSIEDFFA